jgi:sec-independent protein translocase protein TatA
MSIVLVIVVIIFVDCKLPEIGGALGKSIKEFKNESEEQDGKPIASTSTTTKTEPKVVEAREVREVRADEI